MQSGAGTPVDQPIPAAAGYERPRSIDAALACLASRACTVLAGGTDLFAATRAPALPGPVLDLSGIAELQGIGRARWPQGWGADAAAWRIGAMTTWTDLLRDGRLAAVPAMRALLSAAREVGGAQVQNIGTIGGNLCNASPAADGPPVLLALDAVVELRTLDRTRYLPLASFLHGNRRTALAEGELLTAIWLPDSGARRWSGFQKLGHRRYLVIAIVSVAATLDVDERGRLLGCALAVGACAPTARRLRRLESTLTGVDMADLPGVACRLLAQSDALPEIQPIDDVRGTARYRREMVRQLLLRLFDEAREAVT